LDNFCNILVNELINIWMQRYEIVNGVTEVEGAANETTDGSEEDNGG